MTVFRTFAAAAAVFSVVATPLAAADLAASSQRSAYAQSGYDSAQDTAERHRRWRHRDRVDAGDVIAGVAIIAGIAAIAGAIDNGNKRERYEEPRYDDVRYDERRYDAPRQYQSGGLDQAVNGCTRAIERDVRVDSIDQVSRIGDGWEVRGRLYNGSGFTCAVSGDGRIDRIDFGGGYQGSADGYGSDPYAAPATDDPEYGAAVEAAPGQWSDDAYAQARAAQAGAAVPQPAPEGAQPAYPGGPLPDDDIDGDLGG
jgi:hypothetical protein